MGVVSSLPVEARSSVDFSQFIENFTDKLRTLFTRRADADELGRQRGIPPYLLREIQSSIPLSVFIPEEHGGRGGHVHECQSVLEACSYESLALSLMVGINGALFLQPVTKYGQEEVKAPIFERFIRDKNMGGLMITEPDFGTDALNMQTSYVEEDGKYNINGVKHWGGLTGWADFWLVTARRQTKDGSLARDIDFFITDSNADNQQIVVEELYDNLGLYMIPYGRNRIDVTVPKQQRLEPETNGVLMMLDLLNRSRTQFPGMGMGYLRRLLDEAMDHCRERYVGGKALFSYDQVKRRLTRMQAAFTTCSAMCAYASEHASLENNMARASVPANAIKSTVTDLMQEAAQSFMQLAGAKGYRLNHLAGRAMVDSRSFQIFEGSNDILYQQISESVLKSMRRMKLNNLHEYLSDYHLTARASDYFTDMLDFEVDRDMPQHKLVDFGRMLSRIISMELTIELGERGFRGDLVSNCLSVMRHDVEQFLTSYRSGGISEIIEDYMEDSHWLPLVNA